MKHYPSKGVLLASVATMAALAGCQPTATAYAPASPEGYYPMYYPVAPQMGPLSGAEPAAGPSGQPAPMAYAAPAPANNQQLSAIDASLSKVDERLQRVEKAMLRLDRRMQLVERNELNRMTDAEPKRTSDAAPSAQGGFASADGMTYSAGFQPVSAITSGLQAAPRLTPVSYEANIEPAAGAPRPFGMSSLADQTSTPSMAASSDNELAIWTVSFLGSKVWPERTELPGSRDVVSALKKGQPITVFARGKQPNSVVFRDRVKALSQYLGKVSGQESIPIAALPGSHLDENTVEIFATY